MKATYEQLIEQPSHAFLYRQFSLPTFDAPFHFHPELELTYIKTSRGKRFVGRQVGDFEAGDLVLLGANVLHCWRNTEGSLLRNYTAPRHKYSVLRHEYPMQKPDN